MKMMMTLPVESAHNTLNANATINQSINQSISHPGRKGI